MSALHHIRSAPTRAVVRLQSIPAADREAGMTTAEYAVVKLFGPSDEAGGQGP